MAISEIMVDLETLGTAADSIILSVGAVKFDIESGKIDVDRVARLLLM